MRDIRDNIDRRDIIDRLRNVVFGDKRPGTANSDVNIYAAHYHISYLLIEDAIDEIKRLRLELSNGVE